MDYMATVGIRACRCTKVVGTKDGKFREIKYATNKCNFLT